jgi:hypothetical protein
MMLKTDSEYFPTQHQTAGRFEEHAMDMHCIYCQNQILKYYFDECHTFKGSLLNRMVRYKERHHMCIQIEYLRSYNDQYTNKELLSTETKSIKVRTESL